MGNICGMDIFQRLMSEHAIEFTKIITTEESIKVIDAKVPEIKEKVKKSAHQKIDEKGDQAEAYLHQNINNFKSQHAFYLIPLENALGRPLEEFLNYDELKITLAELRTATKSQVSNKRTAIMNEIDLQHQKFIDELNKQKPKIPLYSDLDPEIKKQVNQKAYEALKDQIAQEKQSVMKQLNEAIGTEKFEADLKNSSQQDEFSNKIDGLKTSLATKKEQAQKFLEDIKGLKNKFPSF